MGGPGYVEEQELQNIEQSSCSSFWKVFSMLFLILLISAAIAFTVLLTKGSNVSPNIKMESESLRKPKEAPMEIQQIKNDVSTTLKDTVTEVNQIEDFETNEKKIEDGNIEASAIENNDRNSLRKVHNYLKTYWKLFVTLVVSIFLLVKYPIDFWEISLLVKNNYGEIWMTPVMIVLIWMISLIIMYSKKRF